jgi:hypothetical protein
MTPEESRRRRAMDVRRLSTTTEDGRECSMRPLFGQLLYMLVCREQFCKLVGRDSDIDAREMRLLRRILEVRRSAAINPLLVRNCK